MGDVIFIPINNALKVRFASQYFSLAWTFNTNGNEVVFERVQAPIRTREDKALKSEGEND